MRRVLIVAFPEFQSLDVTGPLDVFGVASQALDHGPGTAPAYVVELAAVRAGTLTSSTGLTVIASLALVDVATEIDTLLIAGGPGAKAASANIPLLDQIRRLAPLARRLGSVCTGAFVLAAAGLLDGRRATTHWNDAVDLAIGYPQINVDADAIIVKDEAIYTSAGVTAGIDLGLTLVKEDYGRELALAVARELVVFVRRPGGQSQFSSQLTAPLSTPSAIGAVQKWIVEHPEAKLSIESYAKRAGMTARTFSRAFVREVGTTPAAWVETVRVDRAKSLLVGTEDGMEAIAARCGFVSSDSMRRAFWRCMRVSPSEYRERFQMIEAGR